MVKLTLLLSEVSKDDINIVGGKAANLGELIRNNFSVPNGYVVTTDAYSAFIKQNQLESIINSKLKEIDYSDPRTIEAASTSINKAIRNAELPLEISEKIKTCYNILKLLNVAIRSSATAEDLPKASFAGQHDTFLNITSIPDIISSVIRCYASLWTPRAIAYRHKNHIPHDNVLLAVIIQAMIPAVSAGVMFTANPISLEKGQVLIESTFGLGESLVSGKTTPDQFVVSSTKKNKRLSFRILTREISQKTFMVQTDGSGTKTIELSGLQMQKSSLTDDQVTQITEIGKRIEKIFKSPQDIEWAIDQFEKIIVLQSRPITSLVTIPSEERTIWSRGYSDDYWNDPTTPLFYDLLGTHLILFVNLELNSIMGYPTTTRKLLKLSHNHVYFNLNVLKRLVEYQIPPFLRNKDFLNYFPEGSGLYGQTTMKKLPFRFFRWVLAEIRIMLHDSNNGSITKTDSTYYKWTNDTFIPYCKEFDLDLEKISQNGTLMELIELAKNIDRIMVNHFRMVRHGITVHNIGMNLMAQYLLSRFIGQKLAIRVYPILISGLKHKTSETNDQIHRLAAFIHKNPEIRKTIIEVPSEDLYRFFITEKGKSSVYNEFITRFDQFISEFGDRGFSREIYYPRWNEAPQYVFDILKSLVMDENKNLTIIETRNIALRNKTEQFVGYRIRSTRFGLLKYKLFSIIQNFARRYIVFRENQRFNLDKWITRNRNLYLEIGRRFMQDGILKELPEIFFLFKKEIRKISKQKFTEKEAHKISILVEKRQEEFLKNEHTTPAKFIQGSREFNDPLNDTFGSGYFRGIPASQGVIKSTVRVITDIKDIYKVKIGEILVVPKTDPGWTPVFSKIGGLITETGGSLSHGAVVSREYSIPAVTNIVNACQIFQTGMVITLDGNNGSVKVEKNNQ